MSDKDRLDLDHAFRKQDILNFFRHYKNGRFLLIINALSPTASGRLLIDKDQHVSRAGSPLILSSMKGLSVSEIIEEYFPESKIHLPVRKGHIFHSTEPDPVKGLILVSPGNVFRNTETFNDIKQLIDTRIFDFALGFAKPHIEEWDIADRISIFTSKVFVDDINPFTARRHVFSKALCNNGDAMDQVMLILAVPDATLEEGEVIEESWAQHWSAWKPLSFRKIDKNASYTTCSSVQVVKSDRTIAGFKPPGCPKCQDPSATRLLKGNCIRCQSCKLGGTHSVPQAGFHYLEFDDVLVWPWPLSISEWSPDYKWADG
ncbi:hypothetical protein FRC02_001294 [Tulasnella sp. 418]|nr:hypothetical protein FRC02_001294 [Tulasnella sp. 418]